jgi:hypothetical protein
MQSPFGDNSPRLDGWFLHKFDKAACCC